MRKKRSLKIVAIMCVVMCIAVVPQTVFAASHEPYGYSWKDDETGKWHHQYYKYNSKIQSYEIVRRVVSNKGIIYTYDGNVLYTNIKDAENCIVYSIEGDMYAIGNTGKIVKLAYNGKKETFDVNASYFNLNKDDLATSVYIVGKGNVVLNALTQSKPTPTPTPTPKPEPSPTPKPEPTPTPKPVEKAKNRVEKTESAEGQVVKAYKDNKKKVQLLIDGSKVLNETVGVRLSDSVKGAKFLGIDSLYGVYLYEMNGQIYRFKYGYWYSAETVRLSGTVHGYKTDKNGFLTEIVTSKTYKIADLNKTYKWIAKKTYAVSKGSYATMYKKGSSKSTTLSLTSGSLKFNGKTVQKSVKRFYFVNSSTFAYIKSDNKIYTAKLSSPTKGKLVSKKAVTSVIKNANGLATYAKFNEKKVKLG